MHNKTIPLRRVRRRREIKLKYRRAMNTLSMLSQLAEQYREDATIHYPSGGISTKREKIGDFTGYLDIIKQAIKDTEGQETTTPGLHPPIMWKEYTFVNPEGNPISSEPTIISGKPICPDDDSCEDFPDMTTCCDNEPFKTMHDKGWRWH
jgi:hypothetical protein